MLLESGMDGWNEAGRRKGASRCMGLHPRFAYSLLTQISEFNSLLSPQQALSPSPVARKSLATQQPESIIDSGEPVWMQGFFDCHRPTSMSSRKYRVAITGGSGFLASHLLRHMQENSADLIEEVRCIDRKPFKDRLLDYKHPSNIPISYFICELANSGELRRALTGVDVVFHLARKSMDYYRQPANSSHALTGTECYIRDNIEATEQLLDAIFACNVGSLVYVGDAYANLPPVDNFGISEMLHNGMPSTYLLGEYGETRTRAELHARARCGEKLPNGRKLNAVFLRPTFLYGEGDTKFVETLMVGGGGSGLVLDFEGPARSLHQYMYAGNLAAAMDASMRCLLFHPERCSGEFFYCMDDTKCERLIQFFTPLIHSLGLESEPGNSSYYLAYAKCMASELLSYVTGAKDGNRQLSSTALRWLYGLAFGFSNRKQALLLHGTYKPVCDQAEAMRRTAEWFASAKRRDQSSIGSNLPRPSSKNEASAIKSSLTKLEPAANINNILRMG